MDSATHYTEDKIQAPYYSTEGLYISDDFHGGFGWPRVLLISEGYMISGSGGVSEIQTHDGVFH